ncbi:MAG: TRAP transporter substrate-binding protein DctP [Magnetococcales bacterium]|nr:TRAP transporter substrate-binding protein DctP [Magnetococcales bacterium]
MDSLKPTVMRIMTQHGEGMAYVGLLNQLKQNIESRTQGQLVVELLTSGKGASDREIMTNQMRGTLEGGWISGLTMAQRIPSFQILNLPLVFNDANQLNRFINSSLDKAIRKMAVEQNLMIMGYGSYGFYGIMIFDEAETNSSRQKSVDALEYMGNRMIRVPGDAWVAKMQETLPGKVVRGNHSVDKKAVLNQASGLLTTPELIASSEWLGRVTHFLNLRHIHGWTVFSINRAWFETLPPHQRMVVGQEAEVICQKALQAGVLRHDNLVQQWYIRRHPLVLQASWDRMAQLMGTLIEKTSTQLEGLLALKGLVRALWDVNFRLGMSTGSRAPKSEVTEAPQIQSEDVQVGRTEILTMKKP